MKSTETCGRHQVTVETVEKFLDGSVAGLAFARVDIYVLHMQHPVSPLILG